MDKRNVWILSNRLRNVGGEANAKVNCGCCMLLDVDPSRAGKFPTEKNKTMTKLPNPAY